MSKIRHPQILVDTFYLIHRSLHIGGRMGAHSVTRNRPSGHVYFAIRSLQSLLEKHHPTKLIFAWDFGRVPSPNSPRHLQKNLEYKAQRTRSDKDEREFQRCLFEFLELIQHIPCQVALSPGFEADDVIASTVRRSPAQSFVIISRDYDLGALLRPNVIMTDGKITIDARAVCDKFFIRRAAQISLLKALRGDKSDNIAGVKGISPKFLLDYPEADNPEDLFRSLKKDHRWLRNHRAEILLNWHLTQLYDVQAARIEFSFDKHAFQQLLLSWDIRTVSVDPFQELAKTKRLW